MLLSTQCSTTLSWAHTSNIWIRRGCCGLTQWAFTNQHWIGASTEMWTQYLPDRYWRLKADWPMINWYSHGAQRFTKFSFVCLLLPPTSTPSVVDDDLGLVLQWMMFVSCLVHWKEDFFSLMMHSTHFVYYYMMLLDQLEQERAQWGHREGSIQWSSAPWSDSLPQNYILLLYI